jgi:hypothetical protein
MARRAAPVCALAVLVAASAAPADAATRPALRDACRLVTNDEVKTLMGRSVKERRSARLDGCVWLTRRPVFGAGGRNGEEASVTLLGHHGTVRQAKRTADIETTEVRCGLGWDPFLPSRRSPWDQSWLSGCSDVVFRLGRIVAVVHTFTNDVPIDSPAAGRRTTKLAKIAARRLGRLRCPRAFCP